MYLALAITLALIGCSSKQQVQSGSRPPELAPWFCHQTPDGTDWQCERTQAPADVPVVQQAPVEETPQEVQDNPPETAPTGGEKPPDPPPPVATDSPPDQSTSSDTASSASSASSSIAASPVPASSPGAVASVSVPLYQSLAYRPDEPVSLLDLPPHFYAAQLTALSSREDLERYAEEQKLDGVSGAPIASNGKVMYVLLLGVYESLTIAREAVASIEDEERRSTIWLRSLGSLQRAMHEALVLIKQDQKSDS
jgi:DamX protein